MAKRTDANQKEIMLCLRNLGATVQSLHTLGRGCPDIIVGWRGRNYLFEIKTTPVGWKLTPDEKKWHNEWRGQVCVVANLEGALAALGLNIDHYEIVERETL